jgi:hypothetical protein
MLLCQTGGRTRPFLGDLIEIACDESGSEGEKLIGGNTDVFAHAGVRLSQEAAASCIDQVRHRAPSPTTEYKSGIIRRSKHREALKWMLGPSGPLLGNAHVFLIDKTFLAVGRVAALLAADPATATQRAEEAADTLYREGRRTFGRERWQAMLKAFNDLMRTRNGRGPDPDAEAVFRMVAALRAAAPPGRLADLLDRLQQARPHIEARYDRPPLGSAAALPALDPLIPAIGGAVTHWGAGGEPVTIVHDRQTLLTEERVAQLRQLLGPSLAGLRLVASQTDPRIQVADLLAGAARMIAEDELHDRGDPELTALLRPYVTSSSLWGDDRSGPLLLPSPVHEPR